MLNLTRHEMHYTRPGQLATKFSGRARRSRGQEVPRGVQAGHQRPAAQDYGGENGQFCRHEGQWRGD